MKTRSGQKIDFKHNLKEYWSILERHKWKFFLILFITAIVEILLVIDRFLFKIIIDNGEKFLAGSLLRNAFVKILIIVAVVFLAIVVLRSIGQWLKVHLSIVLATTMVKELKSKYFGHILELDHSFHITHKTGSLISRISRGTSAVGDMTDIFIFNVVPMIVNLLVVSISLAYFNMTLGIVIVIISVIFISYNLILQSLQQSSKLELNAAEDYEKGFVSDVFTNVDSIKYFGKEDKVKATFSKITGKTQENTAKYENYYKWLEAGHFLILGIGTIFLIYFPLMSFLNKEITLGTLVFVYTIYGNMIGPMFYFVGGVRMFYRAMGDFQDLFEYWKIKREIKDIPNAKEIKVQRGGIEFKNLEFNYKTRKMFKNFNLKIIPNEKIALVGHSGSGKTTLVKLLYRFYDPVKGEIRIDGKNIKDFKQESLRQEMSIVPQECILFDDTIFNNIKFSNSKASREEVERAIKLAQLDRIIQLFPEKEKTIVGERGVKLSGGEKQRVSIARAILANKKILVLDEATSSLDSETEHEIQKGLQKLMQGRTSIIIAHRLSTIMNADRIIVLKKGEIAQMGKHRDLIFLEGEYKKLWTLQKGGYIN